MRIKMMTIEIDVDDKTGAYGTAYLTVHPSTRSETGNSSTVEFPSVTEAMLTISSWTLERLALAKATENMKVMHGQHGNC